MCDLHVRTIDTYVIGVLFSFWNSDGSTQQLAGCLRDFRNKPFATRARIEYYMNSLTVSILENFLIAFISTSPSIGLFPVQVIIPQRHDEQWARLWYLLPSWQRRVTETRILWSLCRYWYAYKKYWYTDVIVPRRFLRIFDYLGGLADDHDVLHFLTTSLYPPGQLPLDGSKVSLEEQAKLQQEYLDYQKKLDEQKEEYRK